MSLAVIGPDADVAEPSSDVPAGDPAEAPAGTPAADAGPASGETGATAPSRGASAGLLAGSVAGLFGLLVGMQRIHDNSFLTHLATGRIILDERSVPTADPYSFTAHGTPWVVQSWLASVIYAGAEHLGGFEGIRLVNALLCAALGVLVWLMTARSPSMVVRAGVTLTVLVLGVDLFSGRPLLFGLVGLSLVMLAADGRLDPRWLVPVGWVWVNTHGSFPFAVALLVILAVGTRLDTGRWGREPRVLAWALGGLLLGAVNPIGPKLLLFPAVLAGKTEAFATILEWQAPAYDAWYQFAIVGLLAGAVLALVRRPNWRDALVVASFGILAMTSARNGVVFAILLAPILAGAIRPFGPAVADLRRPILRPALAMVPVLAVVFMVASFASPAANYDPYPVEALEWMDAQGMTGPESRVVAPDWVGNFREAQDGPVGNVFFDDRVDMYPIEIVRDYQVLYTGRPEWAAVLDRYDASAVLWPADEPLGGALERDAEWDVVHRDAQWVVAVPAGAR